MHYRCGWQIKAAEATAEALRIGGVTGTFADLRFEVAGTLREGVSNSLNSKARLWLLFWNKLALTGGTGKVLVVKPTLVIKPSAIFH